MNPDIVLPSGRCVAYRLLPSPTSSIQCGHPALATKLLNLHNLVLMGQEVSLETFPLEDVSSSVAGREYDWQWEPDPPKAEVMVENDICRFCRNTTSYALRSESGVRHYPNYFLLHQSMKEGCRFCGLIMKAIDDGEIRFGREMKGGDEESWGIELREIPAASGQLRIEVLWGKWGLDEEHPCGSIQVNTLDIRCKPGRLSSTTFKSLVVIDIAWTGETAPEMSSVHRLMNLEMPECSQNATFLIDYCQKYHPRCRQRHEQIHSLPTRVIDVGYDEHLPFIRNTHGASGRWVALSYCWGPDNSKLLTLTTKSRELLEDHIELSWLPWTNYDAVIVTRQLGVRYLWVDALCIVQDSASDWEKESTCMHWIYSNAWITIAATEAPDPDNGFLKPNKFSAPPCKLLYQTRATQSTEVTVFNTPKTWTGGHVLYNRGWTLQERLLSLIVIHWTHASISMECQSQEDQLSEAKYSQNARLPDILVDSDVLESQVKLPWTYRVRVATRKVKSTDYYEAEILLLLWTSILNDFWQRELSFPKGKLPALAGIAQRFQWLTGDIYLAGLWLQTLHVGLLWKTLRPVDIDSASVINHKRPCPTWSWISVKDHYEMWSKEATTIHFLLVDWHIELKGSAPFGELVGGWLKLEGWLVSARMERRRAEQRTLYAILIRLYGQGGHSPNGLATSPDFALDQAEHLEEVKYMPVSREGGLV